MTNNVTTVAASLVTEDRSLSPVIDIPESSDDFMSLGLLLGRVDSIDPRLPPATQPIDSQILPETDPSLGDTEDNPEVVKPWAYLAHLSNKFYRPAKILQEIKEDVVTAGRNEDCSIRFKNEELGQVFLMCSREHFRIMKKTINDITVPTIIDLSSGGTFVNDEKLTKGQPRVLAHKDTISLCKKNLRLFEFIHTQNLVLDIPKEVSLRYRVAKPIGHGGFGDVYCVFRKDTCEILAMKRVEVNNDPKKPDEFCELRVLRKVKHPNVITYFDSILVKETLYLFLEFMESDLSRMLNEKKPLEEDVAKHIFYQVCLGVVYLHSQNIIHRDIKPPNILISSCTAKYPIAKITDFGLSKIMKYKVEKIRTLCGTLYYKPPELFIQSTSYTVDPKMDVWSLGVVLYYMLCGELPFSSARSELPIEAQIARIYYKFSPDYIWVRISTNARLVIRKCLVPQTVRCNAQDILNHSWLTKDSDLQQRMRTDSKENFVTNTRMSSDEIPAKKMKFL